MSLHSGFELVPGQFIRGGFLANTNSQATSGATRELLGQLTLAAGSIKLNDIITYRISFRYVLNANNKTVDVEITDGTTAIALVTNTNNTMLTGVVEGNIHVLQHGVGSGTSGPFVGNTMTFIGSGSSVLDAASSRVEAFNTTVAQPEWDDQLTIDFYGTSPSGAGEVIFNAMWAAVGGI